MNIFSFGKIEKEVKDLIFKHFEIVCQCVNEIKNMLLCYKEKKDDVCDITFKIHKLEKDADVLRREILKKIEKGAFLPAFRGELLNFVERVDNVANKTESVGDYFTLYNPKFSEKETEEIVQIADMTGDISHKLKMAFDIFFTDFSKTLQICSEIEEKEELIDKHEWRLKKEIFKKGDLAMNILKKDFITLLCDISDTIENASDIIEIMVVKRKA